MSDTTPRPDETPGDPTAPAQPADVEVTEFVPVAETVPPADAPAAPPAYEQPQYAEQPPPYAQPQPSYAQPQLPPPAFAGATPGTAVAPPNQMSPADERTWGMLSHGAALLATVISGGILSFVAALVMYLVVSDRGPFVRAHAANSLNIQIIASIGFVVSFFLMFVLIGFITYPIIWVAAVVLHVIGMVKANNGEWWNPPMTPQFVK